MAQGGGTGRMGAQHGTGNGQEAELRVNAFSTTVPSFEAPGAPC